MPPQIRSQRISRLRRREARPFDGAAGVFWTIAVLAATTRLFLTA